MSVSAETVERQRVVERIRTAVEAEREATKDRFDEVDVAWGSLAEGPAIAVRLGEHTNAVRSKNHPLDNPRTDARFARLAMTKLREWAKGKHR